MWNCILFSPDGWSGERQPWMAGAATRFRGSYNRRPWELQPKRELQPWMAGSCNRASGGAACGERLDGGVLFLLQPLYSFLRPSRILATSFFHRGPAGSTAISGGWGWLASTGGTGLTGEHRGEHGRHGWPASQARAQAAQVWPASTGEESMEGPIQQLYIRESDGCALTGPNLGRCAGAYRCPGLVAFRCIIEKIK
ncbi:uncharacterized protein [Triticum aestivum]|uniref:uncharacterized protein n=1 Tax=Triticum aestivum TaxID=4565 RepID=UPI001D0309F9|nr:uncharacterized protein LOC123051198 [Triticum aestivum]